MSIKNNRVSVVLFLVLFYVINGQAQLKDTNEAKKSYFKVSSTYLSNVVFMGRQDSATITPYFTPNIGYYHSSGFFVNSGLSFLTNANKALDYVSIEGGYNSDTANKLNGGVSVEKDFYGTNSTSIRSDISLFVSTNLNYDVDFVQINTGLDVMFGHKADIAINLGLSHEFNINTNNEEDDLTLTPEISANMSTLNYYLGYTNRRVKKSKKLANPAISSITSTTTLKDGKPNKLTLLDYEFSIPLNYERKGWGAYFTPTLAVPVHSIYTNTSTTTTTSVTPPTTTTLDSTPPQEVSLKPKFYFEIGCHIQF